MSKRVPVERERERPARQTGGERAGGGHPTRSGSSNEGEMERETTLPPLSSLLITLSPLCDVVCWQVGTTGGERPLKHPWAGTKSPIDSPGQILPTQVTFDHEGKHVHPACVSGTMVMTPSSEI
jgi:hypothetical protein